MAVWLGHSNSNAFEPVTPAHSGTPHEVALGSSDAVTADDRSAGIQAATLCSARATFNRPSLA